MTEPVGKDAQSSDRLLTLYEEQTRLRAELDRLRSEHERLLQEHRELQKNGDQDHDKNGGGKDEKNEKAPDKQDEKKKDDSKDEKKDDNEDDEKEQKPPLRQRAIGWVRNHPVATLVSLVALVILLIAGYFVWEYLESYESTDDAYVDGHIDPISSRISGHVVGVYVENTWSVVEHQTLVDLDPRDYEVALAQARAALAQAQAGLQATSPNVPIARTTENTNVATADLAVSSAEADVLAARQQYQAALADLQQAEANETNAAAEEARYRALVDEQEVSREIYDERLTTLKGARAIVAARRASAEAARKTVDQRAATLEQARTRAAEARENSPRQVAVQHANVETRRADVKAAQARVHQALLNLSYCKIFAPVAGIIGDKTIEVGSEVAPGQEMFAITDLNHIWVTANFKETQIRNMHPRQSVTIHVDALSQDFDGYLENMPGATGSQYSLLPPENATGNFVKVVQRLPVRIRFKPNQPHAERLRPGMSVEPKVWVK